MVFNITYRNEKYGPYMSLIKLSATDSTNDYLKEICGTGDPENGTVVWAEYQVKGRGQKDRIWQSEPGKNLIISRLQIFKNFPAAQQFAVNCAVSLGCYSALKKIGVPGLRIKWPNDIMAGQGKIGGILIENIVKGSHITRAIIGIGINVNQVEFQNLPRAVSVCQLLGRAYDRAGLLEILLGELDRYFTRLPDQAEALRNEYTEKLYLMGEEAWFRDEEGQRFRARVSGVSPDGRLRLYTPQGTEEYDMASITYEGPVTD